MQPGVVADRSMMNASSIAAQILAVPFLLVLFEPWCIGAFTFSTSPTKRLHPISSRLLHASIPIFECEETNLQNSVINYDRYQSFQLFLRLSPLVGGPTFLPLHVELVMIPVTNFTTTQQQKIIINDALQHTVEACFDIHRFDFLPENPKERNTIMRLMQMQRVPAKVRYRHYPGEKSNSNVLGNELQETYTESYNEKREKGITVLFGVGSSSPLIISNKKKSQSALLTARSFAETYSATKGKELHLLFCNCISFCIDIISHLDETHGIDVKLSMPRIFW